MNHWLTIRSPILEKLIRYVRNGVLFGRQLPGEVLPLAMAWATFFPWGGSVGLLSKYLYFDVCGDKGATG